jgi:D-glycero-beta-D-manno-heptose-7-phosphate kinase
MGRWFDGAKLMDWGILDNLSGAHLIVAGESGIDEYVWGDTRRISPEAPVPVVEVESQESKLGLAANVAQNLVSLGAKATLVSVKGADGDGARLEQMIVSEGIQRSVLLEDASRPTLRKVRVLAQKQHVVRVDFERSHPLDARLAKNFTEALCSELAQADGVILQDYGKGLWNPDTVAFVKEAKRLKKPVFVDPSRTSPLGLYRGVTLLTPNLAEAEALTGFGHEPSKLAGADDGRLSKMAAKILEITEADHAIVTCGPYGMVSASRAGNQWQRIPTFAREVFDVTGAGDTVIAVLSLLWVLGEPLARCMTAANAAAGIVVGRIGASSVTVSELKDELERLRQVGVIRTP